MTQFIKIRAVMILHSGQQSRQVIEICFDIYPARIAFISNNVSACLDTHFNIFFITFMNYWGGEVQQVRVSHTLANHSPEIAAYPHPPWPGICPPRPYLVQPSSLGPKLMLKASLTEQYKSSSAYDLSLLQLKLDILYTPDSNSHSSHPLPHFSALRGSSSQILWLTPWSPFPSFLPNPPSSTE